MFATRALRRVGTSSRAAIVTVVVVASVLGIAAGTAIGQPQADASRSDRFWQALYVRASQAEHYDGLEEMARSADVVVVGRIERIGVGRTIGVSYPITLAELTVVVDVAVKGAESGDRLALEMILPRPDRIGALQDSIPSERALFFLRDKYQLVKGEDLTEEEKARERGRFAFVNDQQGIIRDLAGTARVLPGAALEDQFPAPLDGEDFKTVLQRASEAAHG
jgi:hypothetical protein